MIIGSIALFKVAGKSISIMYYKMRIHGKRAILICGGQLKPSLRNHNGQWCQTVEEQAEAFAIDLERRFRPFDTASAAHCRRVESLLDRQVDLSDSSRNLHHLRHGTLD
ncbi:hypothetical protein ACLKA6_019935 [Drosophila palustris]